MSNVPADVREEFEASLDADIERWEKAVLAHAKEYEAKEKNASFRLSGEVFKLDEDRRLVFGWASIVEKDGKEVVDRQGDVISETDMEEMAYKFTLTSRKAGEMHETIGVGRLVESIAFTKEKQKALGIDLGKVGWWVGFKVDDDEVWKSVKDGTYRAFSIGGKGIREKIDG